MRKQEHFIGKLFMKGFGHRQTDGQTDKLTYTDRQRLH